MSKSDNRYELEQAFMLLFENVAQGVIYLNNQGIITEANPAAENLLGLNLEQLKGIKSFDKRWETIKPDLSPFPGNEHPSIIALQTGKPVLNIVMGVKHANKQKHVWLLINAVPEFKEGENQPYRVFTTFTDISDQIDLENKLRQRNKLLHLTTSISQRFINIPLNHIENEINKAIESLGKFAHADRLVIFDYDFDKNLSYYTYEWCADDIEPKKDELAIIPLDEFSAWLNILRKGHSINIPNADQLAKDSALKVLLDTGKVKSILAVPLMDGDDCIGLIALEAVRSPHYFDSLEEDLLSIFAELLVNVNNRIKNDSKLKESETKYREITDNMSDMVWTTDLLFNANFCSASIKRILGYSPIEFIQIPNHQIYTESTINKINELKSDIKQLLDTNLIQSDQIWHISGEAYKKNGELIWFTTDIKPHYTESGALKGFIATTRDETLRKKADDELNQSKHDLGERLKEQECVYRVSNLSQNDALSSDQYFQEICNLIPPGFQDIHQTSVHITYDDKQYYSSIFKKTTNKAAFDIYVTAKRMGQVVIYIPDHLVFLDEEFVMMNTVVGIIEKYKQIRQTNHALISSEAKYKTLFEESPDGFLIIKDGYFIDCNKASELILGADRINIIGKTPRDISPLFQPNGKRSDLLEQEYLAKAWANGMAHFEWVHSKLDGSLVVVDVKLSVIVSGNDKVLFTTWRDITAQKEAEILIRKLKSAVEQSPISIFITDLNGKIEYANPFTSITTGYTNDELIGQNPRILKSGFTNPKIYEELWDSVLSGKVWRGILNNRRKDGSLYWESTTITPIMNDDGKVSHFIAIKEDITERIKIEHQIKLLNTNLEKKIVERTLELQTSNAALLLAKQEADSANHAKSEFLSRMSHELRTPMNAILGFAQLLDLGELDLHQQKSVHHILESGKHLLELINEILEIARIEAGKLSVSLEPVRLNSVFKDLIDTLNPLAKLTNISLINELDNQPDYFVKADKQRLKQVLLNLLNNGIKYNYNNGWVKLYIDEQTTDGVDYIRICVADNGTGIDIDNVKKLFMPFERLGAENSTIEGTGLGLSVVKQLTSLMGGYCGVTSEPKKGSIFWVAFPKSISLIPKLELTSHDNEVINQYISNNQSTVLYIEDNYSNIELVNQIFLTKRPSIKLITDLYGKNALDLALKYQPNVILLDLNLPDIHGSDVFEILKSNKAVNQIPVIIVSADAMPNQIAKLLAAGVKHYLTKPFDVSEFLKLIDQYANLTK